MVLVHRPRTNNVLAMYWVSTSPLAPSDTQPLRSVVVATTAMPPEHWIVVKSHSVTSLGSGVVNVWRVIEKRGVRHRSGWFVGG
jgi:hypothetical protein